MLTSVQRALEDKVDIYQNAIGLAVLFGVARPKVAILAAHARRATRSVAAA